LQIRKSFLPLQSQTKGSGRTEFGGTQKEIETARAGWSIKAICPDREDIEKAAVRHAAEVLKKRCQCSAGEVSGHFSKYMIQ
jgi:hypothetical protein